MHWTQHRCVYIWRSTSNRTHESKFINFLFENYKFNSTIIHIHTYIFGKIKKLNYFKLFFFFWVFTGHNYYILRVMLDINLYIRIWNLSPNNSNKTIRSVRFPKRNVVYIIILYNILLFFFYNRNNIIYRVYLQCTSFPNTEVFRHFIVSSLTE